MRFLCLEQTYCFRCTGTSSSSEKLSWFKKWYLWKGKNQHPLYLPSEEQTVFIMLNLILIPCHSHSADLPHHSAFLCFPAVFLGLRLLTYVGITRILLQMSLACLSSHIWRLDGRFRRYFYHTSNWETEENKLTETQKSQNAMFWFAVILTKLFKSLISQW